MITKDGKKLPWFSTGPDKIGTYSQSLGLNLYFMFVKRSSCTFLLWAVLALPLLIACAMPSETDNRLSVSALAMFSLASLGDSLYKTSSPTDPAATNNTTVRRALSAPHFAVLRRRGNACNLGPSSGNNQ